MPEFAVFVEGIETGPHWVLGIDPAGERFLIADEKNALKWHPMSKCKFGLILDPAAPRPAITLKGEPQIVLSGALPGNGGH